MSSEPMTFGKCPCSGTIETIMVEVRMLGQKPMSDVPQGRCSQCGSRYYKAWVLQVLEAAFASAGE
jgi:hypothetical protein